ncbi:MAG: hypothetical protein FJX76_26635 [Armatimonadetes bacterium]|nr:hypothetical protein [Armatimonadota bacterium]
MSNAISLVNIGKNELLTKARDLSNKVESDQGFPYKEAVRDESDFFVGMLENANDGTLAEIREAAIQTSAKASKKAQIASVAGMGLMVASFLVPLPAGMSMLRLGGMIGGMVISNMVGGKAAREAAVNKKFASQLTEWETALASGQSAPQQPAPAPAPQPATTTP